MKIKFRKPQFSYPDGYTTKCEIWGTIELHGIEKVLNGQDFSYREDQDDFDKELGDGLAKVRALKDFANDAENYLIKQSCIQPKKDYTMSYDELNKDFKSDYAKRFLGQWKVKPVFNFKLKSLVGKWAQRTKSVIYSNGVEDHSYSGEPIFIRSANDTCMEFSYKEYDKWEPNDHINFLTGKWLDDNWKEYELKPVLNQIIKSLVGKWVRRTKPAKRPNGTEDNSYTHYPYIFILSVTDNEIKYNQENLGSDVFRFDKNIEPSWFDNNWEEYRGEK